MATVAIRPLSWPARGAIATIEFYQKWISPRKGFVCAHRKLHQGESCSEFAKRMVTHYGVLKAWAALPTRFGDCRRAAHELRRRHQAQKALTTLAFATDLEGDSYISRSVNSHENARGCFGGKKSPKASKDQVNQPDGQDPNPKKRSCDGFDMCCLAGVDCSPGLDLGCLGLEGCACA